MKKIIPIVALAFLMASCSNGSSGPRATADSTTNKMNGDTSRQVTPNTGQNMAGAGNVDTNGHILTNGKVRMGNDKVINGDVKMSGSTK